jgi:endoglucanase
VPRRPNGPRRAARRTLRAMRFRIALALLLLAALAFGAAATPARDADERRPPRLPLRTEGRWIVDSAGERFKLAGVNWYGAEEEEFVPAGLDKRPVGDIARLIRDLGFNSVRLPWSDELVARDPVVADGVVAANPALRGKHALDVLDAVIDALAAEGLVVILDNHVSRACWVRSPKDCEGLWWTEDMSEDRWIADWKTMALRYAAQPAVVAADLRNEPHAIERPDGTKLVPVWGGGDPKLDWHAAAKRCGDALLGVNENLLVVVEGLEYGSDLRGPWTLPLELAKSHRLVWSVHDYAWFHGKDVGYERLADELGRRWGYLLVEGKPYTAPVWVGEFGTKHDRPGSVYADTGEGAWFHAFRRYLYAGDIDWAVWALNGTQARAKGREQGAEETYGVLDAKWERAALRQHVGALRGLQPAYSGP